MADVDELSYDFTDDQGVLVRKQEQRVILSKGGWATVMFLYRELDKKSGNFRDPKAAIVRFKKWNGVYRKQSSFNVSSARQARQIIDVLEQWYPATAAAGPSDDGDAGADE
jgi:hypothetical protein